MVGRRQFLRLAGSGLLVAAAVPAVPEVVRRFWPGWSAAPVAEFPYLSQDGLTRLAADMQPHHLPSALVVAAQFMMDINALTYSGTIKLSNGDVYGVRWNPNEDAFTYVRRLDWLYNNDAGVLRDSLRAASMGSSQVAA
jgi:hypothetical protein